MPLPQDALELRDVARGPDDIRDPRAGGQVSEVDKFPAFLPTLTHLDNALVGKKWNKTA